MECGHPSSITRNKAKPNPRMQILFLIWAVESLIKLVPFLERVQTDSNWHEVTLVLLDLLNIKLCAVDSAFSLSIITCLVDF